MKSGFHCVYKLLSTGMRYLACIFLYYYSSSSSSWGVQSVDKPKSQHKSALLAVERTVEKPPQTLIVFHILPTLHAMHMASTARLHKMWIKRRGTLLFLKEKKQKNFYLNLTKETTKKKSFCFFFFRKRSVFFFLQLILFLMSSITEANELSCESISSTRLQALMAVVWSLRSKSVLTRL